MKVIGLILFILLLLPIYIVPWVGGIGTMVVGTSMVEADPDVAAETVATTWLGALGVEALCYLALLVSVLVFARGARWTGSLVAFAAFFDLVPVLDWIPLVPTVMLIIAFVFIAKAPASPELQTR